LAIKGQIKSKVTVSAVKSKSKIVFRQTQWMILRLLLFILIHKYKKVFYLFYQILIFMILIIYVLFIWKKYIQMQEFYKVPD
jgi:hypothetical protein